MRHRKKGKTLGRKKAARESMLMNLAESVILYEKVKTTEAKAKEVRPIVEKAITASRKPDLATRRKFLSDFHTELPIKKLFEVLGPRYEKRKGGYTRIVKIGHRQNDGAEMVQIELV